MMGVPYGHAFEAIRKINLQMRRGSAQIWKAFVREVHHPTSDSTSVTTVDEVLMFLKTMFQDESKGSLVVIGKQLAAMPISRKRKHWPYLGCIFEITRLISKL